MKAVTSNILVRALFISFIVFIIYNLNLHFDYSRNLRSHTHRRLLTTLDTTGNTYLPYLIYHHQTIKFNQIEKPLTHYISDNDHYIIKLGDDLVPKYPIMTGLMALPVYLPAFVLNKVPNLDTLLNVYKVLVLGRLAATFYASLSVGIFYLIITEYKRQNKKHYDNTYANKITFIFLILYAFGSSTYSISSRTLWQHTTAQFIISLSLYLYLLSLRTKKNIAIQGFLLSLSVLIRSTNIFYAGFMALYTFINYRKKFLPFLLLTIPGILFMFIYNYLVFGSVFTEGYQLSDDLTFNTPLLVGTFGLIFSPGKGFLFYMPAFLTGFYMLFYKIIKAYKSRDISSVYLFLAFAYIATFVLTAKWRGWDGADRIGPALLTDLLPILALFSYMFFIKYSSKLITILLLVLLVYSLYVHTNAVISRKSRCSPDHTWSFYCLKPPSRMPVY